MKKAFTLIELLVTIAIIGILSSVVLVSLNGAREKAQDARMISDVRSIAGYMEREKDFSDESYPAVSESTPTTVGDLTFPTSNSVDNGTFGWADNTSDPTKYCMWATLNNSSYFVANQTGAGYASSEPTSISDCDFSVVAGGGSEPEPEPEEVIVAQNTGSLSASQIRAYMDNAPANVITPPENSFPSYGPTNPTTGGTGVNLYISQTQYWYRNSSASGWSSPVSYSSGLSWGNGANAILYLVPGG